MVERWGNFLTKKLKIEMLTKKSSVVTFIHLILPFLCHSLTVMPTCVGGFKIFKRDLGFRLWNLWPLELRKKICTKKREGQYLYGATWLGNLWLKLLNSCEFVDFTYGGVFTPWTFFNSAGGEESVYLSLVLGWLVLHSRLETRDQLHYIGLTNGCCVVCHECERFWPGLLRSTVFTLFLLFVGKGFCSGTNGWSGRQAWDVTRLTGISFLWKQCCQATFHEANTPFGLGEISAFGSD
jgi:hypothetical protein